MKPILVQLGPIPIQSFGLFLILAFAIGIALARRRGGAIGISPSQMLDIALYMIIGGIGLSLLVGSAMNFSEVAQAPLRVFSVIGPSGPGFFVALVGALAVAAAYARSAKIGFRRFLDVIAPPITVGYAVAMIGALLAGSIYPAKATDVPWAVTVVFQEVHPVAIYLMLASLGTYLVLRAQERADPAPGVIFFLWLFLFAVARLAAEFFVDSSKVLGPLTIAQVLSLVVAVIAVIGLVLSNRRRLEPQTPAEPAGIP